MAEEEPEDEHEQEKGDDDGEYEEDDLIPVLELRVMADHGGVVWVPIAAAWAVATWTWL